MNSKIIGKLAHGQIITPNNQIINGWVPIICNSEQGYVKIMWNNYRLLREINNNQYPTNITQDNVSIKKNLIEQNKKIIVSTDSIPMTSSSNYPTNITQDNCVLIQKIPEKMSIDNNNNQKSNNDHNYKQLYNDYNDLKNHSYRGYNNRNNKQSYHNYNNRNNKQSHYNSHKNTSRSQTNHIYCVYGPACSHKDTTCKKEHDKELIMENDPMCSFELRCKHINTSCIRYHTIPELIRNLKQNNISNTKKSESEQAQSNNFEINELKKLIMNLKQDNCMSYQKIQLDNLKVGGLKELCYYYHLDTSECHYREDYVKLLRKKINK